MRGRNAESSGWTSSSTYTTTATAISTGLKMADMVWIKFNDGQAPLTTVVDVSGAQSASAQTSNAQSATISGNSATVNKPDNHNTLSSGAKVGIGVGTALFCILLLGGLILAWRLKKRAKAQPSQTWNKAELDGKGLYASPGELHGHDTNELPGSHEVFEASTGDKPVREVNPGRLVEAE